MKYKETCMYNSQDWGILSLGRTGLAEGVTDLHLWLEYSTVCLCVCVCVCGKGIEFLSLELLTKLEKRKQRSVLPVAQY